MPEQSSSKAKSPHIISSSIDPESQIADSIQDSRLSNSFSRSYYSNAYKPTLTDESFASYTQDEDAIRNQTLALADQGLRAIVEEPPSPLQEVKEHSPTQSNGFQSNLSQLINDYGRAQSKPASTFHSKNNSPQVGPTTLGITQLENSDEEDFEQDLVPSNLSSTVGVNSSSNLSVPTNSMSKPSENKTPDSIPLLNKSNLTNYQSLGSNSSSDLKSNNPEIISEQYNVFNEIFNDVFKDVSFTSSAFWFNNLSLAFTSIPAILIGTMLNLLDSVSFGVIIFPTALPIFSDFGPDGIAIFLVSTVVAQLIYSGGGSRFGGGNGGFMIEVVPFFHIICRIIIDDLGEAGKDQVIPTTMAAYALSTVVTGLAFLGLGWFKLGSLMEFFPRHILIGCIGGVGLFLMQTAFELTSKITLSFDWDIWSSLFFPEKFLLWSGPLILALVLQVLNRYIKHSFLAPAFFFSIPVFAYVIVFAAGYDLDYLRTAGWLFPLPTPVKPFYDFYLNFSFARTSWSTIPKVIPAILSLTFFGILHVPINVPALAVSTGVQSIDINRELVSHGVSNIVSGCFGSVQNYLIYSNSVLFIRSGGDSRVAGLLLCFATFILLLMGPGIIGYIPTSLVGALIFHMGIELMKEAIWDTYSIVHPLEYLTILLIVLTMGIVGFIQGIFLGIVLACMFFVVIYSHRSPVRAIVDGTRVRSKVRRLYHQRTFLESVGDQVQVVYLQGFMFFGTVHQLDHAISNLLRSYRHRDIPIRFLILDFSLVNGIDFSASDAFSKIFHRLSTHKIYLIIAGAVVDSETYHALRNAGIWTSSNGDYVQHFEKCNQALEWCENTLLSSFYQLSNIPTTPRIASNLVHTYPTLEAEYSSSPRDRQLQDAAVKVHQQVNETTSLVKNARQPLGLLIQAFQEITDINYPSLHQLSQYFERIEMVKDQEVWHKGDDPDGLYMIEKGLLRINVKIATSTGKVSTTDSALPGTLVGEVNFLTSHRRTATAYVDSDHAILWKLSRQSYARILDTGARNPSSPEALIPYLLTKLALTYSAYDNRLYSDMELI